MIIFAAGIFDMLHKGHIELLKMMRVGDKAIIVLHDDKSCWKIKDKFPVQNLNHRWDNLIATGLVDEVIVTRSTDPAGEFEMIIKSYPDDELVYMRGDDLTKDFPGKHMLDRYKIPIKFKKYTKGVSSSKLRDEL